MSDYREQVCAMAKKGFADKLFAATSGNMSVYDRENGKMYITPGSYPYEIMTPEDIVVIDLDGNILEKTERKPSSEWRLHAAVYRAYGQYNSVVHTHSPYATAFSINHMPIAAVLHEMSYFLGGDVKCGKSAVPGTPEVGQYAIEALEGRYACLMGNHGVMAVADELAMAYTRALYVEDAAKAYSIAINNGKVYPLTDEEVERFRG